MTEEFEMLLPRHKVALYLTHNDHKSVYETAAQWVEKRETLGGPPEFTSPEERAKAIETDELWELQWYPDTPVGSHHVCASSLGAIMAWLKAEGFTP